MILASTEVTRVSYWLLQCGCHSKVSNTWTHLYKEKACTIKGFGPSWLLQQACSLGKGHPLFLMIVAGDTQVRHYQIQLVSKILKSRPLTVLTTVLEFSRGTDSIDNMCNHMRGSFLLLGRIRGRLAHSGSLLDHRWKNPPWPSEF